MIKKIIAIILCLSLITITLTACSKEDTKEPTNQVIDKVDPTESVEDEKFTNDKQDKDNKENLEATTTTEDNVNEGDEEIVPELTWELTHTTDFSDVFTGTQTNADITVDELLNKYEIVRKNFPENERSKTNVSINIIAAGDEDKSIVLQTSIDMSDTYNKTEQIINGGGSIKATASLSSNDGVFQIIDEDLSYNIYVDKENNKMFYKDSKNSDWSLKTENWSDEYQIKLNINEENMDTSKLQLMMDNKYYYIHLITPAQIDSEGEKVVSFDKANMTMIFTKDCGAMMILVDYSSADVNKEGSLSSVIPEELGMKASTVATATFVTSYYGQIQNEDIAIDDEELQTNMEIITEVE